MTCLNGSGRGRRSTNGTGCGRPTGTWERLLQQVQAAADAAGEIDWDISVDSTIVRAHQHAAGARTDPPPEPSARGAEEGEHQDEAPWQSLVGRLVEVVLEVLPVVRVAVWVKVAW